MTKPKPRRSRARSRGISIMEVLVGTSLSLFLLGVTADFFLAQQRALLVQSTFTDSQNVTRTFTDLIAREIRQASYDPTGPGAGGAIVPSTDVNWCVGTDRGITIATPTSIRFIQDLNGDGDTADPSEDVFYYLQGNTIQRQDGAATPITLVTGVPDVGLSLRYFDNSNPPNELIPAQANGYALTAGQRDCVAKVLITVTASLPNPDPHRTDALISNAQTEVAIRSRSLNNI